MSVKPLRDFLVVSVIKEDDKVAGGLLYRPSTVEDKVVNGKVLAVGSGYLTDSGNVVPLEVQVGDTVVFNKNYSVEVKQNGESFFVFREEHVICVLK